MTPDLTPTSVYQPLVSIVLPSYNHARYVRQGLASIIAQTHPNWELVVVDDGSTDDSVAVITAFLDRLDEAVRARIRLVVKPNGGASSALNRGFEETSGTLVCALASDDWYAPDKLARQVALFETGPANLGLVHSNCYDVDADGHVLGEGGPLTPSVGDCFESIVMLRTQVTAPTSMYRREAMERAGGFDESLVAEDVDFFARVAHAGYAFAYDPTPLLYKRHGVGNLTLDMRRWWRDLITVLDKFRADLDPETFARYDRSVASVLVGRAAYTGDPALARTIARAFVPRIGRTAALALLARVLIRARAVSVVPQRLRRGLRSRQASQIRRRLGTRLDQSA